MQLFLFIARANPAETTNNPAVRSAPKWWLVGQTVAIYGIEIRASPLLPTFNFNRKIKKIDLIFFLLEFPRTTASDLFIGRKQTVLLNNFVFLLFLGGGKNNKN